MSCALVVPGPVLIDLPFDIQVEEIEFDPDMYEPPVASLQSLRPAVNRLRKRLKC